MKILVTGADGFLGSNVVRELIKRSHSVCVFLEPGRIQFTLDSLNLERKYGNLLEPASIIEAMKGCDAVIHCAASTAVWPAHNSTCLRINVDGTHNIVQAALVSNISRLVYVSSASTFSHSSNRSNAEAGGSEHYPTDINQVSIDYIRSKILAQNIVKKAANHNKLPAIIVNPTFMIGPHDSQPSSGKLILSYINNKLPGYTSGGRNFVAVKDVAVAICNALHYGNAGECYILGNENLTYKDFFLKTSNLTGIPPLKRHIKSPYIKAFGLFNSVLSSITTRPPVLSYFMAKESVKTQYYSPQKAKRDLQLPQTPIDKAIKDAISWYYDNGYIDNATINQSLQFFTQTS